jgi:hypothetical protein
MSRGVHQLLLVHSIVERSLRSTSSMRGLLHSFPRQRLVAFVCFCLLPLLFFLGLPLFRFYDFDVQWKSQDGSNASNLIELYPTRIINEYVSSTV